MTDKTKLNIGSIEIAWLDGGSFHVDGGTMFGPVPKLVWERKIPPASDNDIFLVASPILVRTGLNNVVIDTGIGNKLTEKQAKIHGIRDNWALPESLKEMGLSREEIDTVILTHCDYDHAGGILSEKDGELVSTFPDARIVMQRTEWEDVNHPNRRSAHTFWEINFRGLADSGKLDLVDGEIEVVPGVSVRHTGGHNRGHQVVRIESGGETAYHLGDLLPSHAHFNPLWVMSYDNYPMDVIEQKEKLEKEAMNENALFLFYHDPVIRACKFGEKGILKEKFER